MKVGITGGTGFIGRRVVELLDGPVRVFSRDAARALASFPPRVRERVEVIEWDCAALPAPAGALTGLDAVIHLAGENVAGRRWSPLVKRRIRDSRVLSTRHLIEALRDVPAGSERPRVLVCASAIGFYGPRGEEDVDEDAAPGSDFLADVCVDWEAEAQRAELHGVREVRVRVGIVLGPGGGALAPMLAAFKMFAGGPVGSGRQWMAWIHRDDVARLFIHAARNEAVRGAVNGTAPLPVRNRDFARALGRVLGRPALLPAPHFGLRLLLGEFADVLVTGQKVVPRRTLESGFKFHHPELEEALREVLGRESP